MASQFDFKGQVALVTGGGSGLGLETARRLAEGGARIVINDLKPDSAIRAAESLGEGHIGLGGDVSDQNDVEAVVAAAVAACGQIDILVNNAGIPDPFVPTVSLDVGAWQRLIDVHLTGTFLASKVVAADMIRVGRGGAIINLSSIGGVIGLPGRTGYSVAKAGIGMMTRVLGCEWGAHRIRVNAVAPGYILTPLLQKLIDEGKVDGDRILRRTPMGEMGTAAQIADAIAFLASDRAAFITGTTLPVDGGYMAYGAPGDAFAIEEN